MAGGFPIGKASKEGIGAFDDEAGADVDDEVVVGRGGGDEGGVEEAGLEYGGDVVAVGRVEFFGGVGGADDEVAGEGLEGGVLAGDEAVDEGAADVAGGASDENVADGHFGLVME